MLQSPSSEHLQWAKEVAECHHEALSRYAYGMCRNRERAEDAVQETYVRLLKQDRRKIESHVKPWLLRVCRSRILDIVRKEGRMSIIDSTVLEQKSSDRPHPRQVAEQHDLSKTLLAYVDLLTPAQQEVLRLKFQGGLSYKEISEITGKSVNLVGVILHQGLKRLKTLVSESDPAPFSELQ